MINWLVNIFQKRTKSVDPVCGMQVNKIDPIGGTYNHDGITYYFCSSGCFKAFSQDPDEFLINNQHQPGQNNRSENIDGIVEWGFEAKPFDDVNKFVIVGYSCICGCTPGVRYQIDSDESGWEHCCCGRVYFAGNKSVEQIELYMKDRAQTKMDEDVGPYTYRTTSVDLDSGKSILVSYAQPANPRK